MILPKSFKVSKLTVYCIVCLFLFMSSCSNENTTPVSVPTTPVITETIPIQPASSMLVNPSSTATKTQRPSHTPTIITPSITQQLDPQATLTSLAYELRATEMNTFPIACEKNIQAFISTNGHWLAVQCDKKSLTIMNKTGVTWVLPFDDYLRVNSPSDFHTPVDALFPSFWTEDDEFLYFQPYIAYDGGGTCFYSFGYEALYRLNLRTGYISTILAPNAAGYEFAFSPNGRYLSYSAFSGRDRLYILDIQTGEQKTIDVEENSLGNLTWSQDGSLLAFSTCQADEDNNQVQNSTLKIYTLQSQNLTTIMEQEQSQVYIEYWDEKEIMKVNFFNPYVYTSSSGLLDLSNGFDQPIQITPFP